MSDVPEVTGKTLRLALLDIEIARSNQARLRNYRRMTSVMKSDMTKYIRREQEARKVVDAFVSGGYEVVTAEQFKLLNS